MKRTLTLKREPLTALTIDELTSVVGALDLSGTTCPVRDCVAISQNYSCLTCITYPC